MEIWTKKLICEKSYEKNDNGIVHKKIIRLYCENEYEKFHYSLSMWEIKKIQSKQITWEIKIQKALFKLKSERAET